LKALLSFALRTATWLSCPEALRKNTPIKSGEQALMSASVPSTVRFRTVTSVVFSINKSAAIGWPEANPVLFAAAPLGRRIAPLFAFSCKALLIETCSAYTPGQTWIVSPGDAAFTASWIFANCAPGQTAAFWPTTIVAPATSQGAIEPNRANEPTATTRDKLRGDIGDMGFSLRQGQPTDKSNLDTPGNEISKQRTLEG